MDDRGGLPNAARNDLTMVTQVSANDTPGEPKQMSAEAGLNFLSSLIFLHDDRKFLESAISDLVEKSDPVRQMKTLISELKALKEPTSEDIDNLTAIIDALENIVCQVDAAVDFCTLGGLAEVQRLMSCKCDKVRVEVLRLIPTLAQNNPQVQDLMLEGELLADLMSLLVSTDECSNVRMRALSGISAIVRTHDRAHGRFRQLNGYMVIMDAFRLAHRSGDEKVANKTAIVFANFARDLGYQGAVDHHLPSCLIHMYGDLPPNSDAATYLREYIDENISLKNIDAESRAVIEGALKRQLEYKKEHSDGEEVNIPLFSLVIDRFYRFEADLLKMHAMITCPGRRLLTAAFGTDLAKDFGLSGRRGLPLSTIGDKNMSVIFSSLRSRE
uniref:TOG domain-containing protein n=1 Tax=Ascaris lumbricoides TaxID=6252 RepID=A0A0M3I4H1_ASCLU